jgi:mRNA interferase YafQ
MLKIKYTPRMKKDVKLQVKRGKDLTLLETVLEMLVNQVRLPEKYHDHALPGDWKDFRECHIESDWLLIYRIFEDELILSATRTGTHSDFGW